MLKASRYNFALTNGTSALVFNARTGTLVALEGSDGRTLAGRLCTTLAPTTDGQIPDPTLAVLLSGGFVVSDDFDEVGAIREVYWQARRETPIVLTLTTTQDCNLGCFYCYEPRTTEQLAPVDVPAIVSMTRQRLETRQCAPLHVDWYGGEPLLNLEFIETASAALQQLCEDLGRAYHASVISNGSVWPEDVGAFVRRHRIRQVQISFDGMQERHNRRRRYRKGYEPHAGANTFDTLRSLVGRLLDHVRVDVRINLDSENATDLVPFVDFARAEGWFNRPFPAVIQPARLSPYSARSGFLRRCELSITEFDELKGFLRTVASDARIEESEAPSGIPEPRSWVCAALANDSIVVGADRLLYRCGLQVGEKDRAVGTVAPPSALGAELEFKDRSFWERFDPTSQPRCSHCSFLPVCWGGCPKKHLESDSHALEEQSVYWRHNLPRLIAAAAGRSMEWVRPFTEEDQFRDGYRPAPQPPRLIPLLNSAGIACGPTS